LEADNSVVEAMLEKVDVEVGMEDENA